MRILCFHSITNMVRVRRSVIMQSNACFEIDSCLLSEPLQLLSAAFVRRSLSMSELTLHPCRPFARCSL